MVGEQTRGGANPGTFHQFDEHFAVFVPTGHMINEKTKSNWEGVGIAPDVAVAASDAKKAAQKVALELAGKLNEAGYQPVAGGI